MWMQLDVCDAAASLAIPTTTNEIQAIYYYYWLCLTHTDQVSWICPWHSGCQATVPHAMSNYTRVKSITIRVQQSVIVEQWMSFWPKMCVTSNFLIMISSDNTYVYLDLTNIWQNCHHISLHDIIYDRWLCYT